MAVRPLAISCVMSMVMVGCAKRVIQSFGTVPGTPGHAAKANHFWRLVIQVAKPAAEFNIWLYITGTFI